MKHASLAISSLSQYEHIIKIKLANSLECDFFKLMVPMPLP